MPKLTYQCTICHKQLVLSQEYNLGTSKLYSYKCGHLFAWEVHKLDSAALDFTSTGGDKHARDYQKTGVEFVFESNFNCIIADQMRLGKTPQSLLALKNALATRTPTLIVVKSANLWQWTREFKTWVTTLPNGIFPITMGSKSWIPPGFSAYIISMDTFSRPAVQKLLREIQFKLVIVDEAHSFKNSESNRSQALVDFIKFMNTGEESLELAFTCNRCQHEWTETGKRTYDKRHAQQVVSKGSYCPKCKAYCYISQQHSETDSYAPKENERQSKLLALANDQSTTEHERSLALQRASEIAPLPRADREPCGLILLTGTPILNRADEYFVPLNLVAPERFSSLEGFRRAWLQQDSKGQWSRVQPYRLEEFKRAIAPYVLRREKEDVYKDLPILNRIYTIIEPTKDAFSAEYNRLLDKMEVLLAEKANPSYWDMADDLMELRRICGMMKIMWTADYLEACLLDSSERSERYAVGIHHKSVRDILAMKLGEQNCLKLSGEDNSDRKDWIMQHWQHAKEQILIINMLAGGVGMDFHYCNNVLILERQWNSPIEEQFEFRFYNPDLSIKKDPTNIEYIIAKGTIDEWWHDMVESKRRVFGETVANHWELSSDSSSFRELMERTLAGRL